MVGDRGAEHGRAGDRDRSGGRSPQHLLGEEEREAAEKVLGLPPVGEVKVADRDAFIKDLENALLAAKIGAYAQGFAVMAAAFEGVGWNLPMPTIAKIWRAGCIIRSQFLDEITTAFTKAPDAANLIVTPAFVPWSRRAMVRLRRVVSTAVLGGLPVPALGLGARLFRQLRRGRGTGQCHPGASATSSAPTFRPYRWCRQPSRTVGQRSKRLNSH